MPESDDGVDREEPPPGWITVRSAIGGVGLLWLAAMAGFGALQASMYAIRVESAYALVAGAAAAVSVAAGYGSLRSFGLT
jgi:multidrug transporter EmrE-like cation transporter